MGWIENLKNNGYATISGVFSKSEVDLFRRDAVMALGKETACANLQVRNGFPALMFWPENLAPSLRAASQDPRMIKIVQDVIGDDVDRLVSQIYYRMPGDGDMFQWHRDSIFRTPKQDFLDIESKYLQTIIVIDDVFLGNGPIEFIPGSHKWSHEKWNALGVGPVDQLDPGLRHFRRANLQGEKVLASPGDVIVWDSMVVHGSEKNESGDWRMNYMQGFAAADAVLVKNKFPAYLRGGKHANEARA